MTTTTTSYTVTGMTCEHCQKAVATEIRRLTGVTEVEVDLTSGVVTVTSQARLDESAVGSAIDEAGFALSEAGSTGTS
ncbi:MAG: heavy-metal-associated domain-containing protein [Acidimicrobiales bacterium]